MWKYFFETTHTIENGIGFRQFGVLHLLWLLFFVLVCISSVFVYKRLGEVGKRRFLLTISALLLLNELSKYVVLGVSGHWRADYLPFHLCSINIFVVAAYMIKRSDVLGEVLYAVCMPGALIALLCPSWTVLPPTSFMHIHSFTVHIELFLFPLLIMADGFKPRFHRLEKALPVFLIVAVAVFIFNKIYDTNFMFLNGAGEGNPLTIFENLLGNPLYLISLPFMLGIVWSAMYGVPALFGKIKK